MGPIAHIRKHKLGVSQAKLAEITGATQPTVSRWERGELEPNREEMDRIRTAALGAGIAWDDRWFFEVPAAAEAAA